MPKTKNDFHVKQFLLLNHLQSHQQQDFLTAQNGTQLSGYLLFLVASLSHFCMCLLPGVGNGWQ
jgi:hypothetical protein